MKRVLFISIMLLAATATVFAAGGAEAARGNIIKFGVFQPLTGANAAGGAEELDGIRLAHDLYPTVTVGGKEYKIELVVADNKSDKEIGRASCRVRV